MTQERVLEHAYSGALDLWLTALEKTMKNPDDKLMKICEREYHDELEEIKFMLMQERRKKEESK